MSGYNSFTGRKEIILEFQEENGFSVEYECLVRTYSNDYNKVNHNLITDAELKELFKNGVYYKAFFNNEQLFDFEGLKGRLLSSSYTPLPGEHNYEMLVMELKKLFDRYETNGKILFKYWTEAYIGEV